MLTAVSAPLYIWTLIFTLLQPIMLPMAGGRLAVCRWLAVLESGGALLLRACVGSAQCGCSVAAGQGHLSPATTPCPLLLPGQLPSLGLYSLPVLGTGHSHCFISPLLCGWVGVCLVVLMFPAVCSSRDCPFIP